MFAKCPAGRPGTADEVADVAELVMSERAGFITGSTFLVDGGATASFYYGPLQPETKYAKKSKGLSGLAERPFGMGATTRETLQD